MTQKGTQMSAENGFVESLEDLFRVEVLKAIEAQGVPFDRAGASVGVSSMGNQEGQTYIWVNLFNTTPEIGVILTNDITVFTGLEDFTAEVASIAARIRHEADVRLGGGEATEEPEPTPEPEPEPEIAPEPEPEPAEEAPEPA